MCDHARCAAPLPTGSRRRRLWELETKLLCPVVGTCFPLSELRRRTERVLGLPPGSSDFDIHLCAIRACERRSPLAERLQAELETRHALRIREFRAVRDRETLRARWREAVASADLAGALWAMATHPLADEDLLHELYGEIHMLQHQVGAAERADRRRLQALSVENGALVKERDTLRAQFDALRSEADRRLAEAREEAARWQAQATGQEAAAAAARAECERLRDAAASRTQDEAPSLQARLAGLKAAHDDAERRALAAGLQVAALQAELAQAERTVAGLLAGPSAPEAQAVPRIAGSTVACVGGRPGTTDLMRRLVERQGARWLHHDGGLEESPARIEAVIAAADAVICQTGCISHGAYWRVKEHCRRTGKACVFVERPGLSGFLRGLHALSVESS